MTNPSSAHDVPRKSSETTPLVGNYTTLSSYQSIDFSNGPTRPGEDIDISSSPGTPNKPITTFSSRPKSPNNTFTIRASESVALPPSFFSSLFNFGDVSMTLENSGSVARDHLALERTFLAYLRTSLAVASSGVALVQLFTVSRSTSSDLTSHALQSQINLYIRPLGATAVVLGLAILSVGVRRYFSVQSALIGGKFPVAKVSAWGISIASTALVCVIFAILATGQLGTP